MSSEIKNLAPKAVWKNFAALNSVPRASKDEGRVVQFIKDFGEALNLKTVEDSGGNVIITKPATSGMENRKKTVLQSHLDMVHQKNNDTDFDFDTEGINMYVDGDWVRAKGTTLGADNGLGVAAIMSLLESKDIAHPALEALFTIDEETGMTGAKNLDPKILEGDILLNLDTEEDDEIGIGCAGGIDLSADGNYTEKIVNPEALGYEINVKGLSGGHSGMEIIKGLGNANKLMNRVLFELTEKCDIQICAVNGGGLRNAIPRESVAKIALQRSKKEVFEKTLDELAEKIKEEYASLEENLTITAEKTDALKNGMPTKDQIQFLKSVYAAHNGVYRMSPTIDGLVETSNNVARVEVGNGEVSINCLTRSSMESGKWDLANSLRSGFELAGYKVVTDGDYPGWKPNPDSDILKVVDKVYQEEVGEKAEVAACHAGLECGILGSHYPKMDMISFGPTIRGAHSPDERASISSTQKFWGLLLEVLKNIPE
jgi:dipeptidase D